MANMFVVSCRHLTLLEVRQPVSSLPDSVESYDPAVGKQLRHMAAAKVEHLVAGSTRTGKREKLRIDLNMD
jgi:hypothetical protein